MKLVLALRFMIIIEGLSLRPLGEKVASCIKPILCSNWKNKNWRNMSRQMEVKFFNPWKETKFLLMNRNITNRLVKLNDYSSLSWSMFDETLPTKVIIHGFLNSEKSHISTAIPAAYIRNHDVNVIKVGWGGGSKTICYDWAKNRVADVGKVVAEFLDFLIGEDQKMWKKITIVGHSLGAHVAGFVGRSVKLGRVGTIIGLDPALPRFNEDYEMERLNQNDAEYVEIIHTNAKCYGMKKAIGKVDFYVNGGKHQPGCLTDRCHHSRSVKLFMESLENNNNFFATRCENDNVEEPVVADESSEDFVLMGGEPGNMNAELSGIYCLKTSKKTPFGNGEA